MNFVVDCAAGEFAELIQVLLSKKSIMKKKPKFLYSDNCQKMIIISSKHQFRKSEFTKIFLSGIPFCFEPIVGKMEKTIPRFSMFKSVGAIEAQKPEHLKQSEGSELADADHVNDVKGFEDQDIPQAICADKGRRQLLASEASVNIAGKESIVRQFLRVYSAIAVEEKPKITNSEDFLLMADDLISRNDRTNALISQLEKEIALLQSTNRKLEQALSTVTQINTQVLNDAKQARRIKNARKRDRRWGAAASTWKDAN